MSNNYIIHNGQLINNENLLQFGSNQAIVYEVLRVIDHIPLFFDEHIQRLDNSCAKIGKELVINQDQLFKQLIELSRKNDISEGNIMLEALFHNNECHINAKFIPHVYPSYKQYDKGVQVGFLKAERDNPEVKITQTKVRKEADKLLAETGLYEVLLLNQNGYITEGSRSNCFYIKDNSLYTAPLDKVLKGITLLRVLSIAKELNIDVFFENISAADIHKFDALFICGTSPKILPVAMAGQVSFNVKNPLIALLQNSYDQKIANDIEKMKEAIK